MIAESVDHNEAAGLAILLIRVERHRRVGRKVAKRDIIKAKRIGSEVINQIDVDLMLDPRYRERSCFSAEAAKI